MKLLIDKLQKSYSEMLDSVERCKLVVSRLWALFYKFTVDEGFGQLCTECDNKRGIERQLLMERQFHKKIISVLNPSQATGEPSKSDVTGSGR